MTDWDGSSTWTNNNTTATGITLADLQRAIEQLRPQHVEYVIEWTPGQLTKVRVPNDRERRYRAGSLLITTDETEARLRDQLHAIAADRPMITDLALGLLYRVDQEEAGKFLVECLRDACPPAFRFPDTLIP
jgi:hypothetical protein